MTARNIFASFSERSRIRPFSGGSNGTYSAARSAWDELRIGTGWGDVTPFVPVPETGSGSLAGLGLAALLRPRRR